MNKPAPHVSAQAWAIYDRESEKLLFGRLEKDRREIASLTKIMTAYTLLSLAKRFEVDIEKDADPIKAHIPTLHLTDHTILADQLLQTYSVGDTVRALCFEKDVVPIMTLKPLIMEARE